MTVVVGSVDLFRLKRAVLRDKSPAFFNVNGRWLILPGIPGSPITLEVVASLLHCCNGFFSSKGRSLDLWWPITVTFGF